LRKQVESAELKNQRLKEVFQTKIQEFRKVCYTLTGYQIDVTTESQYRLTSRYAEHQSDCLIFKKQTEPTRRTERTGDKTASFCTPAPTVQSCQSLQDHGDPGCPQRLHLVSFLYFADKVYTALVARHQHTVVNRPFPSPSVLLM
ncbi:hypothetical protein STEG23_005859, partial [Scotinomys teguina]